MDKKTTTSTLPDFDFMTPMDHRDDRYWRLASYAGIILAVIATLAVLAAILASVIFGALAAALLVPFIACLVYLDRADSKWVDAAYDKWQTVQGILDESIEGE